MNNTSAPRARIPRVCAVASRVVRMCVTCEELRMRRTATIKRRDGCSEMHWKSDHVLLLPLCWSYRVYRERTTLNVTYNIVSFFVAPLTMLYRFSTNLTFMETWTNYILATNRIFVIYCFVFKIFAPLHTKIKTHRSSPSIGDGIVPSDRPSVRERRKKGGGMLWNVINDFYSSWSRSPTPPPPRRCKRNVF